jgi:subtilisin family serine protease
MGLDDTLGYQFLIPQNKLSNTSLKIVADSADAPSSITQGGVPTPQGPIDSTGFLNLSTISQSGVFDTTFLDAAGDTTSFIRITSSAMPGQNAKEFNVEIADYQSGGFFGIDGMDLYKLHMKGDTSSGLRVLASQSGEFLKDTAFATAQIDNRYRNPDDSFNVASPAAGKGAIGVGAYKNKVHAGLQGNTPYPIGALSNFSSKGPTSDGRIKPEITAPGENVESAVASSSILTPVSRTTQFGPVGFQSGTSMASPVVAGGVALLLQARPGASHQQIKQWIINNAKTDQFTSSAGPLPNGAWGHGKLDLMASMQKAAGATERLQPREQQAAFSLAPNPASNRINVSYLPPAGSGPAQLTVYNATGQQVLTKKLHADNGRAEGTSLDISSLSSGVYVLKLQNAGISEARKFIKR